MQKILTHDDTGAELILDTAAICLTCPPNVTALLHGHCMLLPKGPDTGLVMYYCEGQLCVLTLQKLPGAIEAVPAPWLSAWIASPKVNKAVRMFPWVLAADHDAALTQLTQLLAGAAVGPAPKHPRGDSPLDVLAGQLLEVGYIGLRDYAHDEPARHAHVVAGSRQVLQAATDTDVVRITQYITTVEALAQAMIRFGGIVQLEFDAGQDSYVVRAGTQPATYHMNFIDALHGANRALLAVAPAPVRTPSPENN